MLPYKPLLLASAVTLISSVTSWVVADEVPTTTALDIQNSGRPENLFAIVYGAEDKRCQPITEAINRPYSGSQDDILQTLSHTGFEVGWQTLPKGRMGHPNLVVEAARVDLYNNGLPVFAFRIGEAVDKGESNWLVVSRPDEVTSDLDTAIRDMLVDGEIDPRRAIAREMTRSFMEKVGLLDPRISRGSTLFNVLSVGGVTYVLTSDSNFKFSNTDFLWIYIGRPDGSFPFACVFNPRLRTSSAP
jgi:hypothetical protein